jgi:hypothetical protein
MRRWLIIALVTMGLSACDDRKCLKSHQETQCICSCINNIPVTSPLIYDKCDIYEDKK